MKEEARIITSSKVWSKKEITTLEKAPISETNKRWILNFQHYLFSIGCGELRVAKLAHEIKNMLIWEENGLRVFDCDLDKVTKQAVLNLVSYINRKERYSEATKSDYRRCIKQFYKWFKEEDLRLYDSDEQQRVSAQKFYQYVEKEVKKAYKVKQIDPSTVLTDEDIELVVSKGCRTIKEKAFIKFLHETGLRAGELLNLKVKHIELKKNIGIASVDGKTGRRAVQFAQSMSYLVQWLGIHPNRDVPESYLWLGECPNRLYEPLMYRGANKLVQRCFQRAGLKKRYNLHWFRHSRASLLAPHLTESLLCKYMGWSLGSEQVRTYLHLCPQQLEDAFLKINGLAEEEKKSNLPQKCSCNAVNDQFARYCFQCGNPLKIEIALQDQELVKFETDKTVKLLMEIMQNPELFEKFRKFKESVKTA